MEIRRARLKQVRQLGALGTLCALLVVIASCGDSAPQTAASQASASAASSPTASSAATSSRSSPAVSIASASPSPSPSASPRVGGATTASAPPVRGWVINQQSADGRITGRHCGPKAGLWVVDGTYDRQGQKGQQHWEIDVLALSALDSDGDYSYTDHAVMTTSFVIVNLDAEAKGHITLTFDSSGRALMHFTESSHTYRATAAGGGRGSGPERAARRVRSRVGGRPDLSLIQPS